MIKVLFLIHDLGPGGAEKVLVNLVNHMDPSKFDITLMSLFDVGVNKKFLKKSIRYRACFRKMFRGNSHFMKLLSPERLHRMLIRERYDIEVSYLEGPCARIISGCPSEDTKLAAWIHTAFGNRNAMAESFRSFREAVKCYNRFHRIVCVSETVKQRLMSLTDLNVPVCVLYNTNDCHKIVRASREDVAGGLFPEGIFKMITAGKLQPEKGIGRLFQIAVQLKKENYRFHLYILGSGPEEAALRKYAADHGLTGEVDFLGYQENPYKYLARCDLFVCSSRREGFSTAATEALIVGTPVCTVDVSGMSEMLGANNEYGVVTANDDASLLEGIKKFMDHEDLLRYYKKKASERGRMFGTDQTVRAVEEMLFALMTEVSA